jgi:catechol 2,3-dioxygenase-like lactoylglutathione lyase family enzyme
MIVTFDHTSLAVPDARQAAEALRRDFGATPICGEVLPEFRYAVFHVGDERRWARLEVIGPGPRPGFVDRFLARHGAGPHHLTFVVSDLRRILDEVSQLGLKVIGADFSHPAWQEAFIAPDPIHGTVIQLAQTDKSYPSPAQLLTTTARDLTTMPSNRGATDREWWSFVWDAVPGPRVHLRGPVLATTGPELSRRLFGGVLRGHAVDENEYRWDDGSVFVDQGNLGGIQGMRLWDGREIIGPAWTSRGQ